MIAMGKPVAARSWSRSKPSHTGLRPGFDLPAIDFFAIVVKSKKERTTGRRDRTTGRRGRG